MVNLLTNIEFFFHKIKNMVENGVWGTTS